MKRFASAALVVLGSLTLVVLTSLVLSGASLARQSKGSRAAPSTAPPDQVIQWNQELLQLLSVAGAQPATIHPTRTLAITQLAVYDAVNAIEGGSAPYRFHGKAPRQAFARSRGSGRRAHCAARAAP